jgi:bifunctional DNA-binding transcriptional regulator/antitoxin component of YhaV-PrlF toxin-antitoxin module
MARLTINKNGQAMITIPKNVIEGTGWKNGEKLYIGKKEGQKIVFIEKIEGDKK